MWQARDNSAWFVVFLWCFKILWLAPLLHIFKRCLCPTSALENRNYKTNWFLLCDCYRTFSPKRKTHHWHMVVWLFFFNQSGKSPSSSFPFCLNDFQCEDHILISFLPTLYPPYSKLLKKKSFDSGSVGETWLIAWWFCSDNLFQIPLYWKSKASQSVVLFIN